MSKKKKYSYVPVHPDFHRKLKVESGLLDMSIVDYTESLARKKKEEKEKKDKVRGFEFGF
jgi:hypothetical protein